MDSSPQVLRFLSEACSSRGFPQGHNRLRHPPAPVQSSSMGCGWISAPMDLHSLQRHSLSHHDLRHVLHGNLWSRAWTTSSPSFSTDFGGCTVVHLPPLFSGQNYFCTISILYSSLLCYPRGTTTISDWSSLYQWLVHLGSGCHWLSWTWRNLLAEASLQNHPYRSSQY